MFVFYGCSKGLSLSLASSLSVSFSFLPVILFFVVSSSFLFLRAPIHGEHTKEQKQEDAVVSRNPFVQRDSCRGRDGDRSRSPRGRDGKGPF